MALRSTAARRSPARAASALALLRLVSRWQRDPRQIMLFLIVALATGLVSSLPGFVAGVSDDGMREAVGNAPAAAAGISLILDGRIGISASGDSFADLSQRGDAYREGLPESLRAVTTPPNWIAQSPPFQMVNQQGTPLYSNRFQYHTLHVRYQRDLAAHVQIVEGHAPQPRQPLSIAEALGTSEAEGGTTARPTFEIALTASTLTALNASLGDRFLVLPSVGGTVPGGSLDARPRDLIVIFEVVGVIAINEPNDPYWFNDHSLARPAINQSGEQVYITAYVMAAEDEEVYADLYRVTRPSSTQLLDWNYTWQLPTVAGAMSAAATDTLLADLRNLLVTRGPITRLFDSATTSRVQTSLPTIIGEYVDQRRTLVQTLAIGAVALVALAVILVGLVAALIVERRRSDVLLVRARGADTTQLVTARVVEALLLCIPAGICGWAVRALLFPQATVWPSVVPAIAIATIGVLTCIAASLPLIRQPLGQLPRNQQRGRCLSLNAVVGDGFLVVVAVIGLLLLRRRGFVGSDAGGVFGVDPYLVAVPFLVAAAISLLITRLVPLTANHLTRLAQRRTGVPAFLALRRVAELPATLGIAARTIMVATAIASFGFIVHDSITHEQRTRTWQTIGADYRIDTADTADAATLLPTIADIDGVDDLTAITAQPGATIVSPDGDMAVTLIAVDPTGYQSVVDGTPLDNATHLRLQALSTHSTDGAPGILLPSALEGAFRVGATLQLQLGDADQTLAVAGFVEDLLVPSIDAPGSAVLIADTVLDDLVSGQTLRGGRQMLLIQGDASAEGTIRAQLSSTPATDGVTLTSAHAQYRAARDAPLARGLRVGFWATAIAATGLAASTCLTAIVISAPARTRQFAFLRTLGMQQRDVPVILIVELLPLVLAACALGVGVGVLTAWLVAPVLRLNAFLPGILRAAEATDQAALHVSWLPLLGIPLLILAACMLMIAVYVLISARTGALRVLRLGET